MSASRGEWMVVSQCHDIISWSLSDWLALRREADGAALQTDLQTVGRAAAVLQYPTIQHGLTGLLGARRLPGRLYAAAANRSVAAADSAHSTCQTLPHRRTHGQQLAEQTGQETVNATVVSGDLLDVGGVRL